MSIFYAQILLFIVIAACVGFASAVLAKMLDSWMDYGHILGRLRFKRACRNANKEDLAALARAVFNKTFTERIEATDRLYWQIAVYDFWFLPWICVKCLSFRINFVIIAAGAVFMLCSGIGTVFTFVSLFMSIPVTYYLVNKD